jgi:glycerophosphoryl diester phosphodiesterase
MPGLAWLTARPIAHRGLHDAAGGIVENTASAFTAAIAGGYGIETDLQISADGEAMVHHDDALGRLTEGSGRLAEMSAAEIKRVRFKATTDRILTLLLELKSHFDGDTRLVGRAAAALGGYGGPVGVMSFDPDMVEAIKDKAPDLTRGIVAERHYPNHDWGRLPALARLRMAFLLHGARTRPHFIAYAVRDLPAAAPLVARYLFGLPLLTWTVRSENDRVRAVRWADQMIFEGIRPAISAVPPATNVE